MKKLIVLVVLVAVLGGAGYWQWHTHVNTKPTFRHEEVSRGRLVATITSTGTLQPREVVDVGAQVAGPIIFIGKDSNTQSGIVDWGSAVMGPDTDKEGNIVKKGTVLAQIDDALYRAQFNSAQAAVKSAQADLLQKTAVLHQTTADWARAQKLFPTGGIAQAEYDQFHANFEVAQANVEVSKANIGAAQANMRTAETNLNYTTITSPVNGVVIDRRVNVGQTVVASLSAPSLFLIAKDLSKMEVWATVNEVDVGKIKVGQKVTFTVDAYPGKKYRGTVVPQGKLSKRLNATMNQNVVTYTVVVSADNSDGTLDPYLTTNLTFVVEDKKDVLLVPNAALRWQPNPKQIAPDQQEAFAKLKSKKRTVADESQEGIVWQSTEDGYVRFTQVRMGPSDSVHTELLGAEGGGELPEHAQVVTGEAKTGPAGNGANPFSVQIFKPKPKE